MLKISTLTRSVFNGFIFILRDHLSRHLHSGISGTFYQRVILSNSFIFIPVTYLWIVCRPCNPCEFYFCPNMNR